MASIIMRHKLIPVLIWLSVWQVASMCIGQTLILVSPLHVCLRLCELVREYSFWQSILFSSTKIMFGFFLAVCVGSCTAWVASRFLWCRSLLSPLFSTIKSTPVASFTILALFWFSTETLSSLISFLMMVPLVYTNMLQGLTQMDKQLSEVCIVFEVSQIHKIRYVYLPQLFPYIRACFASGLGLCWKSGTAAEVIAIPDGSVGEQLQQAKVFLQMPDLFAWTVTIILVSLMFEKILLFVLDTIDKQNKRGAF